MEAIGHILHLKKKSFRTYFVLYIFSFVFQDFMLYTKIIKRIYHCTFNIIIAAPLRVINIKIYYLILYNLVHEK